MVRLLLRFPLTDMFLVLDEPIFGRPVINCISGLVVEYVVAIDVTRVRFPADALFRYCFYAPSLRPGSATGGAMHNAKWRVVRRVVRE